VSLDSRGRIPGEVGNVDKFGVGMAMVGACKEGQGREYITQEQSGLHLQTVTVAGAVDPGLPQYDQGGSVASSVGVVSRAARSRVVVSGDGKSTPFHRSR
jgi:hypothetical protein